MDAGQVSLGGDLQIRLAEKEYQGQTLQGGCSQAQTVAGHARRTIPRQAPQVSEKGAGFFDQVKRQCPARRRDGTGQDRPVTGIRGHREEGVPRAGRGPAGNAQQLAEGD